MLLSWGSAILLRRAKLGEGDVSAAEHRQHKPAAAEDDVTGMRSADRSGQARREPR